MTQFKLHRSPNRNQLTVALLTTLSLQIVVGTAVAQDAQSAVEPNQGSATELDTVTVTGTRISNPNVISSTPISTITAEQIKATGAINIGDVMTKMPQLATSFTMGNSGRFIGTAGVQSQDLRNLGTNRTLVLVNGRRFVGAAAGDTAVDVNMIPSVWIERIEVITGGASAVYGADAVTGVVNFILKKNFEGGEVAGQWGTNAEGFIQKSMSASFGSNFANNRGNAAFAFEHSRQNQYNFSERFGSNTSYRNILTPGNEFTRVLFPNAGLYSTLEGGTFTVGDGSIGNRYTFNPDGTVRPQRFDGPFDNSGCANCDYVNLNNVRDLEPKYSRSIFSTIGSFDFSENHRGYWEGTFAKSHVKTASQPAFGTYFISQDNAYAQAPALQALMEDHGPGLGTGIILDRFDLDSGRRGEDTDRYTSRVVFGVEGTFGSNWNYDTYVNYGQTRERRHNLNNRWNQRFAAGLDAVVNASGDIVCRATINPGAPNPNAEGPFTSEELAGCVPFSVLGAGAITPGAADWFNLTTTTQSKITQFVAGGALTNNDLFQMPGNAGSASLSTGIEYRRETSRQINDPRDIAGTTFLNAIPSFSGSYDVKEAFAEFGLPLVADRPFFKNLSLNAAARFSDYDTIGNTTAWKWGLDWAFDDNVRMRGTMSKAVRAPNISELFSGQSQNFFSINDPCSASRIGQAADPAVRATNCAALGIPAGYESNNSATIEGVSGSNPDLEPETSRSYTFGFVVTPQFAQGLSLNVDYWNIKIVDAVSGPSGQQVVDNCVDTPSGINNEFCADVQRDPASNEVIFVTSLLDNISELSTSGIDFGASYSHDVGPGRLFWDLNATRVIAFTNYPFQTDPDTSVESNQTLGFPEWKATLQARYALKNWTFNWNMRYFSEMLRVTNESYDSAPNQVTPIFAGSRVYNDVRAAWNNNSDNWQIYGGVNNLFDRDAPVNIFGDTFGGALYDSLGRSYYVGATYKF